MIFGAEYSDDYREGFDAGRASAELVCGEQHAFLDVEVEQLRAEVDRLQERLDRYINLFGVDLRPAE